MPDLDRSNDLLARLREAYARAHGASSIGMSPVDMAMFRLDSGDCWQMALAALQDNYDPATARAAWVAILTAREPLDPRTGRRSLYCVPGYDALCGDAVPSECVSVRAAGQVAAADTSRLGWALGLAALGVVGYFYFGRAER